MTKHEKDDYEDIFGDWREPRSGTEPPNLEDRKQLHKISSDIQKRHALTVGKLHYDHVLKLVHIIDCASTIYIKDNKLVVPKDLEKFKNVKRKTIKKLINHLEAALNIFYKSNDNETLAAALRSAIVDDDFSNHLAGLSALLELAERAEKIYGQSGNRPLPDWIELFCEACQDFWIEHKGRGTRLRFDSSSDTSAAPGITAWVVDLFKTLTKFREIEAPISQLRSVAKDLPAKRGPKKTT